MNPRWSILGASAKVAQKPVWINIDPYPYFFVRKCQYKKRITFMSPRAPPAFSFFYNFGEPTASNALLFIFIPR